MSVSGIICRIRAGAGIGGALVRELAVGSLASGASGTVHAFSIGDGGSLTRIQIANIPDGGSQEGIAAN